MLYRCKPFSGKYMLGFSHCNSLLGGALSGAFGGGSSQVDQSQAAPVDYQYQQPASYQQQQYQNPCEFELKQFLDCAQNQYDVSLCQGFNEALKQCKISNNIAM